MRINKYGNLYMLTFPLMLLTNIYLYEEKGEVTLVDTSLENCASKIIKYIKTLEKPLTKILLTHAHDDHMGGLFVLLQEFPKAEVFIGAEEKAYFVEQCQKKWNQVIPYQLLKEGNVIGLLTTLETAGHTKGSVSFLDKENRTLLCGDLMHSQGGLTISGDTRILFPFPDTATISLEQSIVSVKKLKNYMIDKMFCGHGKVTEDFSSKLDVIIQRAEQRML